MATDPKPVQAKPAPPAETPAAPPPAEAQAAPPPEIPSTPDERQMAMVAHWGGMLPFGGFLIPLGLWATKLGQSPFVEDQAKESLNLQINVLMLTILFAITCMIYIGYVLLPSLLLTNAIHCYMAGMAAKEGKVWRYPFNIRYVP